MYSAFFRPGVSPDAEEEAGVLERVVICDKIPFNSDLTHLNWKVK
jgi:hypothetical protein